MQKPQKWYSKLTGEPIEAVRIAAEDLKNPGPWTGVSNFKEGSWILNPSEGILARILHDHLFKLAYTKTDPNLDQAS